MTLRIITGTIIDARDPFMVMHNLYKRGIFVRWRLTEHGWERTPTRVISGIETGNKFSIIQTTGSGKTILAVLYAFQAHQRGVRVGGNLSLRWTKCNEGRPKEKWLPIVCNMEDIEAAKFMHIIMDDIRGTIAAWNTKDAKMVSEVANATRKKGNYIDITTQRMAFVPPDMRQIADEIVVPFIRCVDETRKAPDGRGVPLEVVALRFSAGYEFLDYHIYNLSGESGLYLLDSYNTLELAVGLKQGEKPINNRVGSGLEIEITNVLNEVIPQLHWEWVGDEGGEFDIRADKWFLVDAVKCQEKSGRLETSHKDWIKKTRTASKLGKTPLLVWKYNESYFYAKITNDFPQGKDLDIASDFMFKRARGLATLPNTYNYYFSKIIQSVPIDAPVSISMPV